MATCDVCGNAYDKAFSVIFDANATTLDASPSLGLPDRLQSRSER